LPTEGTDEPPYAATQSGRRAHFGHDPNVTDDDMYDPDGCPAATTADSNVSAWSSDQ
jgi:hypothetical protein